ncbi:MAG TPA: HAMP domain-containing sensor histidine kinase [Acidimicrobiales bacterium]|nr:HAMP domain-containing sensor histidine kinase [Acidimicrobiales bacterium]
MAIRTRILIVVLVLVLVALAVLSAVSYTVVRRSLISTADSQLQTASSKYEQALSPFPQAGSGCYGLPVNSFGALYYESGRATTASITCPSSQAPTAGAPLASLPPGLPAEVESSPTPVYTDVSTPSGEYRIAAQLSIARESGDPNGFHVVFVVGEPMGPVNTTLRDILLLEVLVSALILLAGGTAAYFLVQIGLRPLEKMAETAGEIAAGDLSRRVEDTDPRTEVGELGTSLNVMLSRIEEAFRDKEASEAQLRRFVADASHELRTPLTSIRGYAELFRDNRAARPEDVAAALRRIEDESARMSGLVEDLLLLARLDQGRPLEEAPVDLASIAEDAVRDARVVAPERSVTLRVSDAEGEPVAIGDEQRLRQVTANLVSNAIAHTPAGSPVEVVVEHAGSKVRLAVIDHGPGVRPEEREKIFGRFWRADESRHRAQGGSGLGLAIVAAVVAAHGGRVGVSDTPGGGATFTVELRAAAPAPGAPVEGGPHPPWADSASGGPLPPWSAPVPTPEPTSPDQAPPGDGSLAGAHGPAQSGLPE